MKPYAEWFYKSTVWIKCRNAYMNSVDGMCEDCDEAGITRAARIVHHKIPITPQNIFDLDITLNWENLRALCDECHYKKHHAKKKTGRRCGFDLNGQPMPGKD